MTGQYVEHSSRGGYSVVKYKIGSNGPAATYQADVSSPSQIIYSVGNGRRHLNLRRIKTGQATG
jgi:hypothetical protein